MLDASTIMLVPIAFYAQHLQHQLSLFFSLEGCATAVMMRST